jgi:hypothetical protein
MLKELEEDLVLLLVEVNELEDQQVEIVVVDFGYGLADGGRVYLYNRLK